MARATLHAELWWADLDKRRPAVVVSRDDSRGKRQRTTVATVTTMRRGIPSEVRLDEADGLPEPSVVNCDELVTIPKALLIRRIGQLSASRVADLHQALAFALALPR
jgi:mRNA interferase MazF